MLHIEVLGAGCSKCKKLHENVQSAVARLSVEAQVDYITDYKAIVERGIMQTPALIIDGQVTLSGQSPSVDELERIVSKALAG